MSKKLVSIFLLLTLFVGLFTGCGGTKVDAPAPSTQSDVPSSGTVKKTEEKTPVSTEELEPVTLKWLVVGTSQEDQKKIFDLANVTFQEKLNATVTIDVIDWGTFDEKLKMAIATGEDYDICFTSGWTNPFVPSALKGAFLPLDDLLENYGQNILAQVPAHYWDAVRINGQIHSVINYQVNAILRGVSFPKDMAEKYNLDTAAIRKYSDLTPYFETIKENEPDMIPFLGIGAGAAPTMPDLFDFDTGLTIDYIQGNSINPLAIRVKDGLDVFNAIESEEFMEFCKMTRDWYEKGYVPKDAASLAAGEAKSGRYAAFPTGVGLVLPKWKEELQDSQLCKQARCLLSLILVASNPR